MKKINKTHTILFLTALGLVGCNNTTNLSDLPQESNLPSTQSEQISEEISTQISETSSLVDSSANETVTYTATFLVNGEVFYTQTGEEGERIVSPKNKPTIEHKTFKGWDGFTNGNRFTSDVEYNAIFEDTIYTVTFMIGNDTYQEFKGIYGTTFEKPADPTISGGSFLGWENFNEETDLTILDNVIYNAKYSFAGFPYISSSIDMTSKEKDEAFLSASPIETFDLTLHTTPGETYNTQKYSANVVYDDNYLYVYIESVDNEKTDSDRLSFYIQMANGSLAQVDFRANTGEAYTNSANATAICGKNAANNYVLKAKISLGDIKVENSKIFMSFRFINNANDKFDYYASVGATTKSDGSGKIESTSGLVSYDLETK